MATQRKIYHLLQTEGQNSNTFQYLPNLRVPFDLSLPILVTEKVDGSTMQFKSGDVYKRYDCFKAGDPRKHSASEEERYELRKCDEKNPSEKWYLAGFNAYKNQFEAFGQEYPEYWVYFETLGEKIGARYPQLMPTVRVFDVSKNGKFLPFETAKELALRFNLPVVKSHTEVFGSLENLIAMLTKAGSHDEGFPEHKLEGWVLRQQIDGQEVVAKIRVNDLKHFASF